MSGREKNETGNITLLGNQNTKYSTDYSPEVLEVFPNKHRDNDCYIFSASEITVISMRTA